MTEVAPKVFELLHDVLARGELVLVEGEEVSAGLLAQIFT